MEKKQLLFVLLRQIANPQKWKQHPLPPVFN